MKETWLMKSVRVISQIGLIEGLWFLYPFLFVLCFALSIKRFVEKDNIGGVLLSLAAGAFLFVMYGTLVQLTLY